MVTRMKTRRRWWWRGALVIVSFALGAASACSSSEPSPEPSPAPISTTGDVTSAPAEVNSNVRVLPDDVAALARLEGDILYLPSTPVTTAYGPGDILLSGVGRGFLRTAISRAAASTAPKSLRPQGLGDAWVAITTASASLVDVFRNVDATLTYTPASRVHRARRVGDRPRRGRSKSWMGGSTRSVPASTIRSTSRRP